jgi:hypothetical protein
VTEFLAACRLAFVPRRLIGVIENIDILLDAAAD